ncbi:MAG: fibronectin type III domain-containing protein [Pseudomonadota bacterium]
MQITFGLSLTAGSLGGPSASPSAPVNLFAPAVSPSSGNVNDVLTCSIGGWSGIPSPSFTYQWKLNGENIPGEILQTITTTSGGDYTCEVTATNSEGSASETSNVSTIGAAFAAPTNTAAPSITPTSATVDDQPFTRVAGTYTGNPAPTVTWVWRKGTTPIAGTENQGTYAPTGQADVGADYNIYETATNGEGSVNIASSNASASLRAQATLALADQTFSENTGEQTYDVASDTAANGNTLSWSLVAPPAGVTIAGSLVTVDTDTASLGTQAITVRAIDEYSRQTNQSFDLQILDVATAPAAFVDAHWSVTTGSGPGELAISIASLPANGGATITDVEYDLNGSNSWISSSGTGSFTIASLTESTSYTVRLRAVNSVGIGPDGNTETGISGASGSLTEFTGLFPASAADFTDPSHWPTSANYTVSGGTLTFDNTTGGVSVLSDALTTNIVDGRHYAVYVDASRRDAGSLAWRGEGVSGGSQSGTAINGARRALDSFTANRDIDEFGVRGTPFDGDVDFVQVYDITDEVAGPLDIHILAGQSNMVGASATTGFDTLTEEIELRALSISGTEQSAFKFHTDETGPTINAALGSKDGIGLIRGGMIEPVTHSSANFEGVSPATSIAKVICDASVERPIFACLAHGGSDLFDEWDHTGAGTGEHYDLMLANVDYVHGLNTANKVKTFFWCQGESSTHVGYAPQFKAMIDTLRAMWGEFLVVIMEHGGDAAFAGHIDMKAEQQKLATGSGDASELTRCIYVERPAGAVLEADGTHFTGTTNRTRGTEAAQAAVAAGFDQALVAPGFMADPVAAPATGYVGEVLSATNGTTTGNPSPGFTYQWQLDGVDVPGATSSSVTTHASGDWTCDVTATNSQGSVTWPSNTCTIAAAVVTDDFAIQHFSPAVMAGGRTQAITGVDLNSAFILNNHSVKQSSGQSANDGTGMAPDELGLGVRFTASDTITLDRESSAVLETNASLSVLEYIGDTGGANEFIVRDRRTITLTSASDSFTPSSVVNADKCIPMITGQRSSRPNLSNWDHALAATSINRSTGEVTVDGRGSGAVQDDGSLTVEVTTVEFTGSNWTVHYATENADTAVNGTLTLSGSVASWSNAWIMHQFAKAGLGNGNSNDIASIYRPGSALNEVDWSFDPTHTGNAGQRHTVYVLENPSMTVSRFQDSVASPAPVTGDVDVSSLGLALTTEALLYVSTTISDTGANHPNGQRTVRFTDENTVRHFAQNSGSDLEVELQVIQLPNIGSPSGGSGTSGSGDTGGGGGGGTPPSGGGSLPAVPEYPDSNFNVINLSAGANIQNTINGLSSLEGVKIKLAAGNYASFAVDWALHGNATLANPFVIEGPATGVARILDNPTKDSVLVAGVEHVILDRLYIEGAPNRSRSALHVRLKNAGIYPRGFQLLRSTIARRTGDGIKFSEVYDTLVDSCFFSGELKTDQTGERHLDFNKFDNMELYRCTFDGHRAVNVKGGSRNAVIAECVFNQCQLTMEIGEREGNGYWDVFDSIRNWAVIGTSISDCMFNDCTGVHIKFKDVHDFTATNNRRTENGVESDATYQFLHGNQIGQSDYQNSNIVVDGVQVVPPI